MSPGQFVSLRTLAFRRLALVSLGTSAVLMLLAWLGWEALLDAHAERLARDAREHYAAKMVDYRSAWRHAAQRQRAQIEFLRIGEVDAETRRARLRGFFTAQGESREFAGVLIADAEGLPLFSLGCQVTLQEALDIMRMMDNDDVYAQSYCTDDRSVHSITRAPLWLGEAGKGIALFATALDNAFLTRLARGADRLYLFYDGSIRAASSGGVHLADPVSADPAQAHRHGDIVQVLLPLDSQRTMDGPVLVVQRPFDPLLSTPAVLAAAAGTALLLTGLIWLGLGITLRRHLARLSELNRGSEIFHETFARDDAWSQTMEQVASHPDEIGQLGRSLNQLMEEAERRLTEQTAYAQTLDMLDEVVVELGLDGRLTRVSRAWATVTGIADDVLGHALADYLEPEDVPALQELVASLARREKPQAGARLRLKGAATEERWLEVRLTRATDGDRLRGVLRDITQSYLQERRITHMALHDALTGLPNRALLEDRLKVAMRLAGRSGHKVALGFIDLDHFKNVNDSLGHKVGDALLVALAQRLRHHLRSGDTLARWGGDEFVVLLPDLPGVEAAREVAAKLREAVEAPLRVEDTEFNLTFSAGFVLYPDDANNGDVLLAQADRAMFYAKAQGRNTLQFFADMSQKGLGKKEVYIQQRLVAAIRERRITNHYQPLVDAGSRRVVGVETLARWHEPDMGWISPATFIPMAENLGLIRELGEQVWRQALEDAAQWHARGIGLSVNISKRQVFMPFFTEKLLEDVAAHGLAPGEVTLEITESLALMDVEYSADRLKELHEAGFRLSIDDFGTGYSSLSQLHELPVHELKIDIAFVRRIGTPQGARLIQTIVGMAAGLGLDTVAEGVEDAEVADALTEMGVDVLQGWHCGRPMPAEEFLALLERMEKTHP